MNKVTATHHLARRNGVYYYRRRVPEHLVEAIGRAVIQLSLATTDLKRAKQLREVKDLEWSARFSAAEVALSGNVSSYAEDVPLKLTSKLTDRQLTQLVCDYVAQKDARLQAGTLADPPDTEEQKAEIKADIEMGLQILKNRDDPRASEIVHDTGQRILLAAGATQDALGNGGAFDELVRRALLEIDRRRLARVTDNHSKGTFDALFDGAGKPTVTFGELAAQCLKRIEDEGKANRTSQKWIDKQHATMALIGEIIGSDTPIASIDYDKCQLVRSTLAKVPTNRSKRPYKNLTLDKAIALAASLKKPVLSSFSQRHYLTALKDVLDLATAKRLIPGNPAQNLGPLKRDDVSAGDKRAPFTPEQIAHFFQGEFYKKCAASGHRPYEYDTRGGWRFWLPLICLFSGMRPNEVCQLYVTDVRCSKAGTWYLDVVTTDDESNRGKTLKTSSSRRQVPVHPELLKIGFLKFVAAKKPSKADPYLFNLTPDKYGNRATYALKRFRDHFLPQAITVSNSQTFYSFRHSFRDALRRIGAPPDALQALGGWSQGKLVSDNYGEKANPDYQAQFINGVAYPGLDLSHLYFGADS